MGADGTLIVANTRDLFEKAVRVKYAQDNLQLKIGQSVEIDAKTYDTGQSKVNQFELIGDWPKNLVLDRTSGSISGVPVELLESSTQPDKEFRELQIKVGTCFY